MHVLMIGDSWSDPGLFDHLGTIPVKGYSKEGHVEAGLIRQGFSVTNVSVRSGSNLYVWELVQSQIESLGKIDWLIWFHTELVRDWPWPVNEDLMGFLRSNITDFPSPFNGWSYQSTMDMLADRLYHKVDSIYAELGRPPMIFVEGQSVRWEPAFSKYFNPHYIVEDWRSQLVGKKLPPSQLCGMLPGVRTWLPKGTFFDHCKDPIELQIKLADDVKKILDAMKESKLFSDDAHPADRANTHLSKGLAAVMNLPLTDKRWQRLYSVPNLGITAVGL